MRRSSPGCNKDQPASGIVSNVGETLGIMDEILGTGVGVTMAADIRRGTSVGVDIVAGVTLGEVLI
jgi:hypothetical protein